MTEFADLLKEIDADKQPLAAEIMEKMPFIEVHPKNPAKQRVTPAGRQYKELTQSYNAYIKTLLAMLRKQSKVEQVSPLREYFKKIELR